VAVVGFSFTIQAFYTKVDLFEKYPAIDEVLGGLLGVVQGLIILGAVIVILDSFFLLQGIAPSDGEIPALRELFKAIDPSGTAVLYRDTLIPAFFAIVGLLLPDGVKAVYP
jgi:hypothetical protein